MKVIFLFLSLATIVYSDSGSGNETIDLIPLEDATPIISSVIPSSVVSSIITPSSIPHTTSKGVNTGAILSLLAVVAAIIITLLIIFIIQYKIIKDRRRAERNTHRDGYIQLEELG